MCSYVLKYLKCTKCSESLPGYKDEWEVCANKGKCTKTMRKKTAEDHVCGKCKAGRD